MADATISLRRALLDRVADLLETDPLRMAVECAAVSPAIGSSTLEDLSDMADRLLVPHATPFERGVMMGAALAIAVAAAG